MAQAEVNSPPFVQNHSLTHLSASPLPKRSRLSLRRTTQILHKPCYKEEDGGADNKCDISVKAPEETFNVEMIDLTQDENASPNCASAEEKKHVVPALLLDKDDNGIKASILGLPNCGNTCYVNSILQVLRFTPEFLNSLHSLVLVKHHLSKLVLNGEDETKELVFFHHLHLLYTAMKRREAMMKINIDKDYCHFLMKPVKLVINSLREVSVLFEEGEQHDAHELLLTTISAFSTACQSLKSRIKVKAEDGDTSLGSSSPLRDTDSAPSPLSADGPSSNQEAGKDLPTPKRRKVKAPAFDYSLLEALSLGFEGRIRYVVQCLECEKRLEKEESFANLEVNIPEKNTSEDSVGLLQCLSQTTILSGENKYDCEECLYYTEARMSSEVVALPPVLLLHFSWLKSSENSNADKTSMKILIPMTLVTSENTEVFCCSEDQTYKLFAVVLHIGRSTEGGHYVSFVKDATREAEPHGTEEKCATPKLRSSTTQLIAEPDQCCTTDEVTNFKLNSSMTRWLLFDDNVVRKVVIDEGSETFPYFDYLTLTASPCMIFYHKT